MRSADGGEKFTEKGDYRNEQGRSGILERNRQHAGYGRGWGAEVLEEEEFEPMFASVEGALHGKKIALFGSWGWGGGAWMNDWEARCNDAGVLMQHAPVICQEAPDDAALAECRELGASLV